MISVSYRKGKDTAGGKLLARYEKSVRKGDTLEERAGAMEKETCFLLYISGENKATEIIEISAEDVICMTLNLVPEMILVNHLEFETEEGNGDENSKIIVEHFNGFPWIAEHKEFFLEPLNQEKCLEILKENLHLC